MADQPASTADVLAFVTTADAGSFAARAKRLGLTRSAVAKAVGRLEARLGTRLMTRSTRRLALTEDGRRFHARRSAALDELAAAEAEVAGRDEVPRGVSRLAAPDAYGRLRVMPLVARYLALHPAVEMELSLSDHVAGIVAEGLDLAVRIGLPETLPPDLVARVIDRLRHGFFAAPGYLASRGRPETLADLAAQISGRKTGEDPGKNLRGFGANPLWGMSFGADTLHPLHNSWAVTAISAGPFERSNGFLRACLTAGAGLR